MEIPLHSSYYIQLAHKKNELSMSESNLVLYNLFWQKNLRRFMNRFHLFFSCYHDNFNSCIEFDLLIIILILEFKILGIILSRMVIQLVCLFYPVVRKYLQLICRIVIDLSSAFNTINSWVFFKPFEKKLVWHNALLAIYCVSDELYMCSYYRICYCANSNCLCRAREYLIDYPIQND